jgi:hypothetical protein
VVFLRFPTRSPGEAMLHFPDYLFIRHSDGDQGGARRVPDLD